MPDVYHMGWGRLSGDDEIAIAHAEVIWQRALKSRNALPHEERGRIDSAKAADLGDQDSRAWIGRSARYHAAQDQVRAADQALLKARGEFPLSSVDMGWICDLMAELGMTFEDNLPPPPAPKPEDYNLTEVEAFMVDNLEGDDETTPEMATRIKAFLAAQNETLKWHGNADRPGIPKHKFHNTGGGSSYPPNVKQRCESGGPNSLKWVRKPWQDDSKATPNNGAAGSNIWQQPPVAMVSW